MGARVIAFAGVAVVLVVVPGPALALVMKNAAQAGRRAGLWTIGGLATAVTVHATASALGLSAVLAHSATAFTVVKYLGAAYLCVLGIQSLRRSWRRPAGPGDGPAQAAVPQEGASRENGAAALFGTGFLTNLLNPKPALFYLAVLPQFIAAGETVLAMSALLVGVHIALLVTWYAVCAQCVASLGALLARPAAKRAIDRTFGAVFIALGVRVAVD